MHAPRAPLAVRSKQQQTIRSALWRHSKHDVTRLCRWENQRMLSSLFVCSLVVVEHRPMKHFSGVRVYQNSVMNSSSGNIYHHYVFFIKTRFRSVSFLLSAMSHLRFCRAIMSRDSDARQSRSVRLHSRTLRLWRSVRQTNMASSDSDYEVARCDFVARQSRPTKSRDKIACVTWH